MCTFLGLVLVQRLEYRLSLSVEVRKSLLGNLLYLVLQLLTHHQLIYYYA